MDDRAIYLNARQIVHLCYMLDDHIQEMKNWKRTKPINIENADARIAFNQEIKDALMKKED
jgi:hypothetical protein